MKRFFLVGSTPTYETSWYRHKRELIFISFFGCHFEVGYSAPSFQAEDAI
jgi:hypothetical protein